MARYGIREGGYGKITWSYIDKARLYGVLLIKRTNMVQHTNRVQRTNRVPRTFPMPCPTMTSPNLFDSLLHDRVLLPLPFFRQALVCV